MHFNIILLIKHMQTSVMITTLDHGLIEIKIENPKNFNIEYIRDEIDFSQIS